ncbi:uncharacterized protein F5891DRAFT_1120509 [Suillus fuscotomentosus]|uniref:GTPase SLIP-GC n=1 Tax=Suillus fuscotomentosus TaxID=1912939 RepID=A0AAD4HD18_9AGAM|nr:uncharacterized protein F5891DRAFT_1120509 [Suillus fuscotomentosus]KAG1886363.1 hypothetical protein F5891DRAFT_1120509 [Suillus fuscotomentosus]
MGSVSRSSVAPRPLVKIEPTEELSFSDSGHDDTPLSGSLVASNIKVESVIEPTLYHLYEFADEITYTPEHALHEGLGMVKTLKIGIEKLELGSSKLRKDVWLREIDSLLNQVSPTMMIAVCGATGAGKSSTINALLDVDVVPTSGMRACTSVVTQISYHTAPTINADVLFLSEAEWREELIALLNDIKAEGNDLKRTTDLHGDSEVAWYKVHAVYPSITLPQLVDMTADQILAYNTNIVRILGTTRKISADDSSSFAQKIARYVDSSTGQKRRGKKNKPRKSKKTSASDNLVISAEEKEDHDTALWPLIRQVNIQCNARALSTGAILVDLPGVADVNPARNRIAKDYMKKCNCIWILAPITRAVDDKTARDLLGEAFRTQLMSIYDAHTITFIATKCDDISCSEVITTLDLKDDPALEKINKCIISCKKETSELKLKKADTESLTEVILRRLKRLQAVIQQCQEGKTALANGTMLMPQFTATVHQATQSMGKKRKNTHSKESGPAKRLKSSTFGHDSEDDTSDSDMYVDDTCGGQKSVEEEQEKEDTQHDDGIKDEPEEVTVKVLEAKIDDAQKSIKAAWEELDDARKAQINIKGALDDLMRKEMEARRDKSTFCSLKRSEFSRNALKEDFRVGLKLNDDATAEERDPEAFDPTQNLRNYDEVDLEVFTCSSRDYVRITGRMELDEDPSCFSNIADTGVPALQKWCHRLAVGNQHRAAKQYHLQLKMFANSVRVYTDGISDAIVADSKALREKWESVEGGQGPILYDVGMKANHFDIPGLKGFNPTMNNSSRLKVDPYGEPTGITPRLVKDFGACVERCVSDLQGLFHDGLEDKCRVGAVKAAQGAVQCVDKFAESMYWNTYRATLRRHGSWHRDLNVELLTPFTRNIASSWSTIFESDLFTPLSSAVTECVKKLLADVEVSAVAELKERACARSSDSQEEVHLTLGKIIEVVEGALVREQKEISRCLAPHVQTELVDGYNRATRQRGKGSVARQKTVFRDYVNTHRHVVFDGGAEVLLGRLSAAAEAVGKALNESLRELAEKVEVSISVLWEGIPDDLRVRSQIIQTVSQMLAQLDMWSQAAEKVSLAS